MTVAGTLSFMTLFATCEVYGMISSEFDTINDVIDQFDWYLFPINVQKALPMILLNVQQPIDINFFGSIRCNRETFRKVNCFNN